MAKDYYDILNVPKDASEEDIKRAYRKLAHKYHPDKKSGDEGKFKEVNAAYQVLSDKQKRTQYDQFGHAFDQGGAGGFSGFDGFQDSSGKGFGFDFGKKQGFEDIFSDIFSSAGFGSKNVEPQEAVGSDIAVDVEITFEEMAKGVEKQIDLYKRVLCSACDGTGAENKETKTCSACNGNGKVEKTTRSFFGTFSQIILCTECSGKGVIPIKKCRKCGGDGVVRDYQKIKVNVPAGIEDGQTIRITGYGEMPRRGGRAGDIFVTIHIQDHPEFKRVGDDIHSKVNIAYSQAVLGGKLSVNTIEGPVKIKITQGTQSGDIFKIRGKGIRRIGRMGIGDHLTEIQVSTPEHLSREQKEAVKLLNRLGL
ncbi:MAG: molecular chaperone DnaJ [Patescibacteria group bacterium]|nr:molecular chaperone DnaJ [Patescibacteria group bacterium]